MHHAKSDQMRVVDLRSGDAAPVDSVHRRRIHLDECDVERSDRCVGMQDQHGKVGDRHSHPRCVLHRLLLLPRDFRTLRAVRVAGGAERAPISSDEGRSAPPEGTVQGEPEERKQEDPGLELHHSDADRGGDRLPGSGNPSRRRDSVTYHIQQHHRDPRLLHRQRPRPLHELLYNS